MLSVTSATVHKTMCPTTPNSNSNSTRLGKHLQSIASNRLSLYMYKNLTN